MTLLLEGIRIAWNALITNKLRTFLTLLGNIVGIMSVIAVVSLLKGIDEYAREEVASEGSNIFTIERINFIEAVTDFESFLHALRHNPRLEQSDGSIGSESSLPSQTTQHLLVMDKADRVKRAIFILMVFDPIHRLI